MDVSIIILNYNTFDLTCNCINSVIEKTIGISYEIILVDNASSESPADLFKEIFSSIKLIKSEINTGFAGGNNLGIKQATGKYILLLNSDTVLTNNSVKITHDYLEAHSSAGVVAARLIYPNGKHQSVCQRFPSLWYGLFELFRLQKLFPKKIAGKILLGAFFNHNENVKADWVWGAYFMFRKKILTQMRDNKLDDTFFMYGEDMQWCWDIKQSGYEIHFCNDAQVIHFMGGSSGKKEELIEFNYTLFMKRNYNWLHRQCIGIINKLLN